MAIQPFLSRRQSTLGGPTEWYRNPGTGSMSQRAVSPTMIQGGDPRQPGFGVNKVANPKHSAMTGSWVPSTWQDVDINQMLSMTPDQFFATSPEARQKWTALAMANPPHESTIPGSYTDRGGFYQNVPQYASPPEGFKEAQRAAQAWGFQHGLLNNDKSGVMGFMDKAVPLAVQLTTGAGIGAGLVGIGSSLAGAGATGAGSAGAALPAGGYSVAQSPVQAAIQGGASYGGMSTAPSALATTGTLGAGAAGAGVLGSLGGSSGISGPMSVAPTEIGSALEAANSAVGLGGAPMSMAPSTLSATGALGASPSLLSSVGNAVKNFGFKDLSTAVSGGLGVVNSLSAREDAEDLMRQLEEQMRNSDPFAQFRPEAMEMLKLLESNPEAYLNSPEVMAAKNRVEQMMGRQAAAQGKRLSGNFMQDLSDFSRQYDYEALNRRRGELAKWAGMDMFPNPGFASAMNTNFGNIQGANNQFRNSIGALVEFGLSKLPQNWNLGSLRSA